MSGLKGGHHAGKFQDGVRLVVDGVVETHDLLMSAPDGLGQVGGVLAHCRDE